MSFTDGRLRIEHGTFFDFLQLVLQDSRGEFEGAPLRSLRRALALARRLSRPTKPVHAKQNVAHHYDLNGRLYDLFLDTDRQYSCAYFETPDTSLEAAQTAKKRPSSQSSWSSRVRAFSISAPALAGWR